MGSARASSNLVGVVFVLHQPSNMHASVAGVMVSIAAFQAVDPGSIPGPRIFVKREKLFHKKRSWSSGYDRRLPSDGPGFNSRRAQFFVRKSELAQRFSALGS